MPLGVFGDVNQQAGYGGRQHGSADSSACRKLLRLKSQQAFDGALNGRLKLLHGIHRRQLLLLQRNQLIRSQNAAFGIGNQTVQAPRDVPHLEGGRRQTERLHVQRLCVQRTAPSHHVFARQFQRVQNGPANGFHVGVRSPQPRLYSFSRHTSSLLNLDATSHV